MSLFVQTNVASLTAQTHFASTELKLAKVMGQLSSGYRINSAADDAAGLGMAKRLAAQVASYGAATRNANDAIAMTATADGGAEQISNVLTRLRELAVQGANGSLGVADGLNLDTEFQADSAVIHRIAKVTTFNGINLLSGAAKATSFQVGIGATAGVDTISVSFGAGDVAGLTMGAAKVDTAANATTAIGLIDAAITTLNTLRAGFGAGMNRMQNAVSDLSSMQTNTAAALSSVQDVDVAQATGVLAQTQVLAQAGESVLAQANQMPQLATSLIRGQ